MIIEKGEKIHVMMRTMFDGQVRRHFAGAVAAAEGPVVRATGFVFIYDSILSTFVKKPEPRTTIFDLSESGYIVNILPAEVDLTSLKYELVDRQYLAVVDGKGFELDVHEFGTKR